MKSFTGCSQLLRKIWNKHILFKCRIDYSNLYLYIETAFPGFSELMCGNVSWAILRQISHASNILPGTRMLPPKKQSLYTFNTPKQKLQRIKFKRATICCQRSLATTVPLFLRKYLVPGPLFHFVGQGSLSFLTILIL